MLNRNKEINLYCNKKVYHRKEKVEENSSNVGKKEKGIYRLI